MRVSVRVRVFARVRVRVCVCGCSRRVLAENGLNRERLKTYERPINTPPAFYGSPRAPAPARQRDAV